MKKLFLSLILLIGGSCLFATPINWYLSGRYSFGTYTMKTEADRVDMLSNGWLVSLYEITNGYNSSSYTGKYSLLSSKANIGLTWNINSK